MANSPLSFITSGMPKLKETAKQNGQQASRAFSEELPDQGGSVYGFTHSFADSKVGSFFCWLKLNEDPSDEGLIFDVDSAGLLTISQFAIFVESDRGLTVRGENAANTEILNFGAPAGSLKVGTWYALFASWDLATTTTQFFLQEINNAAQNVNVETTATDDTLDYDATGSGECYANNPAGDRLDADICQVWFSDAIDAGFDTASNREQFATSGGRPLNLGNGVRAVGTPAFYWDIGRPKVTGDIATVTLGGAGHPFILPVEAVPGPATISP